MDQPMSIRNVSAALLAGALLSACAAPPRPAQPRDDFAEFFARLQHDEVFAAQHISPGLEVTEEFSWGWGADEPVHVRAVACGPDELAAEGWTLVPGPDRLRETGTRYSEPVPQGNDTKLVVLGPEAGEADATYTFELRDGAWQLTQARIHSRLADGQPLPPPPCDPANPADPADPSDPSDPSAPAEPTQPTR